MYYSDLRARIRRSKARYRTWYRANVMNRFARGTREQIGNIFQDVSKTDPNTFNTW